MKRRFRLRNSRRSQRKFCVMRGGAALQYAASDGYDPLRASIAELMRKVGVETDFRHIVITCGSQQALSYLTRALVEPGDVVVCEAPSYVGALDTFRTQQARVVGGGNG